MASSPALALVLLLCIVLLSAPPPPVAAAFLFGGGKSAKKPGKAAGLGMEWQPATATWYGEADGDGNPTLTSPP
jgi:expansin